MRRRSFLHSRLALSIRCEVPLSDVDMPRSSKDRGNFRTTRKSAFAHVSQTTLDRRALVVAWPVDAIPTA